MRATILVFACIIGITTSMFVGKDSGIKPDVTQDLYHHLLASTVIIRTFIEEGRIDGYGTGWITHGKDGTTFITTAGHVVDGAFKDRIRTEKGKIEIISRLMDDTTDASSGEVIFQGTAIAFSGFEDDDVCVLTIPIKRFGKALKLSKVEPKMGERLILAGLTTGFEHGILISEGILGRKHLSSTKHLFDHFSGPARPGCSGGPVVARSGNVVGILSRGKSEVYSLYVPAKRIWDWAKSENISYVYDNTLPVLPYTPKAEVRVMPKAIN